MPTTFPALRTTPGLFPRVKVAGAWS